MTQSPRTVAALLLPALGLPVVAAHAGTCTPIEAAKLTATGGGELAQFGQAIAWDGRRLLVGHPGDDAAAEDAGIVILYELDAGVWSPAGTLTPPIDQPGLRFGSALAIDGDTLLVGAQGYTPAEVLIGAVYAYTRQPGGAWEMQATLAPDDAPDNTLFGASGLAIDGNAALVGAPFDTPDSFTGSVYAFDRDRTGNWSQTDKLIPVGVPGGALFGLSIDLEGETAVIGAPNLAIMFFKGDVFVYQREAGEWQLDQELEPDSYLTRNKLGASVAIASGTIVAGIPWHGVAMWGSVAVFTQSKDGGEQAWTCSDQFYPPEVLGQLNFGGSIAFDGTNLLVGMPGEDTQADGGGIAFYYRVEDGIATQVGVIVPSDPGQFDQFGFITALSGNLGAFGVPFDDNPELDSGSAYIFELNPIAPADLNGDNAVDSLDLNILLADFGCTESCEADTDGDGDTDSTDLNTILAQFGTSCP